MMKKDIEENLKSTILTRFISGFVISVLPVRLSWSLKVSRSHAERSNWWAHVDANGCFAAFEWPALQTTTYRLRVTFFEAVNSGLLVVTRK